MVKAKRKFNLIIYNNQYMKEIDLMNLVEKNTNSFLTHPFNSPNKKQNLVHVYKDNQKGKMIALISQRDGELFINLKLKPEDVDQLSELKGVERGYHMNKSNWITIQVNNSEIQKKELINLIRESNDIISNS